MIERRQVHRLGRQEEGRRDLGSERPVGRELFDDRGEGDRHGAMIAVPDGPERRFRHPVFKEMTPICSRAVDTSPQHLVAFVAYSKKAKTMICKDLAVIVTQRHGGSCGAASARVDQKN